MFDLICFVIGMVLFAAAIIGGISSRHNTQKCVSIILVGTFFASFALILPTTEVDVAPDFMTDVSYRNLTTMLYSLKVLGGRQSVSQIYGIALTGTLRYIYIHGHCSLLKDALYRAGFDHDDPQHLPVCCWAFCLPDNFQEESMA